jgi:hypothetical protein
MSKRTLLLSCAACLLAVLPAGAQQFGRDLALGVRIGTLGPGLELSSPLGSRLNLRLGGHYASGSASRTVSDLEIDIRADAEVTLFTAALLADFFPARRGLRATAGVFVNGNSASVLVTPLENYTIDEKEFAPERIGSLSADVGHSLSLNPYLGLGFGNPVHRKARLSFAFDLGVLYTGSPTFAMQGTGMIAPTADQAPDMERSVRGLKIYPLLSLGLAYKING